MAIEQLTEKDLLQRIQAINSVNEAVIAIFPKIQEYLKQGIKLLANGQLAKKQSDKIRGIIAGEGFLALKTCRIHVTSYRIELLVEYSWLDSENNYKVYKVYPCLVRSNSSTYQASNFPDLEESNFKSYSTESFKMLLARIQEKKKLISRLEDSVNEERQAYFCLLQNAGLEKIY